MEILDRSGLWYSNTSKSAKFEAITLRIAWQEIEYRLDACSHKKENRDFHNLKTSFILSVNIKWHFRVF
jgi:hypothetical protein